MKSSHLLFFVLCLLTLTSCRHKEMSGGSNQSRILSTEVSNQLVTSFCEDCLGHVWIGTLRGVNKCVGRQFQQYFCSDDDSTSIPDNQIRRVFKDSKNRLWVCTSDGICYLTDKDAFHRVPIEWTNKNAIDIMEDSKGHIFINLVPSIFVYDEQKDKFVLAIPNANTEKSFSNTCFVDSKDNIWSIGLGHVNCFQQGNYKELKSIKTESYIQTSFMDPQSRLWIASGNKLMLLDTKNGNFVPLPPELANNTSFAGAIVAGMTNYIRGVSMLFGTSKGFFLYDYVHHQLIPQSDIRFPFSLPPSFSVTTMFVDSQQNLWLGSYDKGIFVKYRHRNSFNDNVNLRTSMGNKSVISVTSIGNRIWMSTMNEGIFVYDKDDNSVSKISLDTNKVGAYLYADRENHLWVSNFFSTQLKEYSVEGNNLHVINSFNIPTTVFAIYKDASGTVYASGYDPNLYIKKKGESSFHPIPLFTSSKFSFTTGIFPTDDGKLMLLSFDADIRLFDPKTNKSTFIPFRKFARHSKIVPNCAMRDRQGNIWIGTRGNGVYVLSKGKITPLTGNSCPDIASIIQDKKGDVWVSSLFGLSKYDCHTKKFTNYYTENGIGGNQFNDRASCMLADGSIYFGGTHGMTFFNPADLRLRRKIPLLFENLKVNNQLVLPSAHSCIDKAMVFNPNIRLDYDQRSFSIFFSAIDYSEYDYVHYFYKIDGYDRYWIEAGSNHEAYYSNLPSGRYTFRVKITSSDVNDVIAENALTIHVAFAPWLRWWAILLYLIIIGIAAWYAHHTLINNRLQKEKVLKAEREKETELHTNQMNMKFFSNISHEFRTPLTMISGPVTSLCNDRHITGEAKQLLLITQRSVNRMLRLVNQLMDFQKLENDVITLRVAKNDIISCIRDIVAIFKVNADEKNVTLTLHGFEDSFVTWFDADKLEKILSNLLSNAMKFTPAEGKIDIYFDATGKEVSISVGDTGPGIPEDKKEDIFKRYYQVENQQAYCNWGTGIGLYYARRLAEIHHGSISVTNKENGGSLFTLILPVGDEAYTAKEKEQSKEPSLVLRDKAIPLPEEKEEGEDEDENPRSTVMVIDDDPDVANYMKTYLSAYFHVECKFDAKSAYKALDEISPDLIVCDVLMPDVDGYQFCRMVKQNISYCHIPVILLTAKTLVQDQVKGLNEGANAYVTKPFDPSYLLALIESQLKNQENLRNVLGHATETKNIDSAFLSDHDSAFMNELYQLMEKELSNPELNITRITEVMHISRTKFYYKMKGLTGMNPNIFFKTYKLNRAAELITEGKYNISEIADMTGYSTLSHFSSSFKKHFGITPSEYK
jgi:signal transduction histidine kinase/DNA-binding response OmpR family regulator/ligand-binding sensor domain-containing protein